MESGKRRLSSGFAGLARAPEEGGLARGKVEIEGATVHGAAKWRSILRIGLTDLEYIPKWSSRSALLEENGRRWATAPATRDPVFPEMSGAALPESLSPNPGRRKGGWKTGEPARGRYAVCDGAEGPPAAIPRCA